MTFPDLNTKLIVGMEKKKYKHWWEFNSKAPLKALIANAIRQLSLSLCFKIENKLITAQHSALKCSSYKKECLTWCHF